MDAPGAASLVLSALALAASALALLGVRRLSRAVRLMSRPRSPYPPPLWSSEDRFGPVTPVKRPKGR